MFQNFRYWGKQAWIIAILVILLTIFTDQISKNWSVEYFFEDPTQIYSVIKEDQSLTPEMRNQISEKKQNIIGSFVTLEFALNK